MRSPEVVLRLLFVRFAWAMASLAFGASGTPLHGQNANVDTLRAALIADLADSSLDKFTLLEAGLIASGVADSRELRHYQGLGESLFKQLEAEAWIHRDEMRTGKRLLQWLHKNVFRKYDLEITDLRQTLADGGFNCVTSAIMFVAACQRFGHAVSIIETPIHVFCKFSSNGETRIVETVFDDGFDFPDEMKVFQEMALKYKYITENDLKITGIEKLFAKFIEEHHEIGPGRLAQLIFYNQMATLLEQQNYAAALALAQQVELLFAHDKKFQRNYAVLLIEAARQELLQKNSEKAFNLILTGLRKNKENPELLKLAAIAVADLTQRAASMGNYARALEVARQIEPYAIAGQLLGVGEIQILSRWAFNLERQGKIDSALIINKRALAIDSNNVELKAERVRFQSTQIDQLMRQGKYEKALEMCNDILRVFPNHAALQDLRIQAIGVWAYSLYEVGKWESCIAVLSKGRVYEPNNDKLRSLMAISYHQHAMELIRQEKYIKALETVKRGLQDCPGHYELRDDQRLLENRLEEMRKNDRTPKG